MVYGDYIVEQDVLCVVVLFIETTQMKKTCCVLLYGSWRPYCWKIRVVCCCIVHEDYTDEKDVLCVDVWFMETTLMKKTCCVLYGSWRLH